MVTLTINGEQVAVPEGTTIMDAAKEVHIDIPHLCYLEGLKPYGACRVCVVEIEGEPRLAPACIRVVGQGMKVKTSSVLYVGPAAWRSSLSWRTTLRIA
jgi:NADH dehydrogenase/NADH:ubiquinone oxidoreductase subunit G